MLECEVDSEIYNYSTNWLNFQIIISFIEFCGVCLTQLDWKKNNNNTLNCIKDPLPPPPPLWLTIPT